ncbi:endoglucanase [Stachybotrys elegans]|uniref:Endoglucanase n=1 Tax=Stachybotrys elegans TaxID=80388 RepID=A0A8K0SNR7_9HYPO|nr:endoglucanase [Stachybotrys elegans]
MKTAAILALALSPLALAQTLCEQYGYHSSNGYEFNNNMWGSGSGQGSQCTTVNYSSGSGVSWRVEWNWSGGQNNVKSYPYSGRQLSQKRIVSQIGSLPTSTSWNYQGNNIRANVAYDLFTASDPNHSTSSGDYELMIWLGRLGDVYPIGNQVGTANVAGQQWNLYYGYNGNMQVYSFVAPNQVNSFSGDVKQFFDYLASNRNYPASSQYLITYQFGTEPFTGSNAVFTASSWSASQN